MAGCTKERFGGHVKKSQKGAGRREQFEASTKKMKKSQKAGGHCWMHTNSKKRTPSKKRSSMKGKKGKNSKKSKKRGKK